jgi:hypothetical protein
MTSSPLVFAMSTPLYSTANTNNSFFNNLKPNAIQYSQPLNYKRFQQRLAKIYSLEYNWNGENGCSVDLLVYINTNEFLSKIDSKILDYLKDDEILPTPYGTITLDFEKNNELVSIEIGENKIGFFTDFNLQNNLCSDGLDFPRKNIPESLKQALLYLCNGN